jgi:hypothetical protein
VTFELWGTSDGRTVSYDGPNIRNVVKPGRATWQYDHELPTGAKRQMVHGRSGMDVNLLRKVMMPDGSILHDDNWYTHYQPWDDFYTYGPGVTPPSGAHVIDPRVIYSPPARPHPRRNLPDF